MNKIVSFFRARKKKKSQEREKNSILLKKLYTLPKSKLQKMGQESLLRTEKENQELISLANKLNFTAWIAFLFSFLLLFGSSYFFPEFIRNNAKVLPQSNLAGIVLVISLSTSGVPLIQNAAFFSAFKSNPINLILDPLLIPRWKKRGAIFSLISIVFSIGAMLYLVGFASLLSAVIKIYVFPEITSLANMIVTNIVSWVFSGVIGNFIYDMLKKIVSREKKETKQNVK